MYHKGDKKGDVCTHLHQFKTIPRFNFCVVAYSTETGEGAGIYIYAPLTLFCQLTFIVIDDLYLTASKRDIMNLTHVRLLYIGQAGSRNVKR